MSSKYSKLIFLAKLPKWFGVRPGKKSGEPDTPEEEDNSHVEADEDLLDLEKEGIDGEEAEEDDEEEYDEEEEGEEEEDE